MRNRLIGIALGVLVAVLATILLNGDRRAPRLKLLAEDDGKLASVALQYTRASSTFSLPCLRAFLKAIDPNVEVVAVCGDAEDAAAARRDLEIGGRVPSTIVVGKPITGWCKDRFLVAGDNPAILVRPPAGETGMTTRTNDALVAPALVRAYPERFRDRVIPLSFDAGDILPCGSKMIVSDTLWAKNGTHPDFARKLEALFDCRVVWLKHVPDHHVGMFAAPVGGDTILVGDPDLARPIWSTKMEAKLGKADFSSATVELFHNAARQLRAAGFKVVGVPTVPLGPQTFISYTNGVFEKGVVYMPTYGFSELDGAARAVYRSVGREVRPIPVETVYRLKGTIGCLINVLERR